MEESEQKLPWEQMSKQNKLVLFALVFFGLVFLLSRLDDIIESTDSELIRAKAGAASRVNAVLKGICSRDRDVPPGEEESLAIAKWYADAEEITDRKRFYEAAREFDEWCREGGLLPTIKEHEVSYDDVEREKDSITIFLVSGTIDGRPFVMRVPKEGSLSWEKAPR